MTLMHYFAVDNSTQGMPKICSGGTTNRHRWYDDQ